MKPREPSPGVAHRVIAYVSGGHDLAALANRSVDDSSFRVSSQGAFTGPAEMNLGGVSASSRALWVTWEFLERGGDLEREAFPSQGACCCRLREELTTHSSEAPSAAGPMVSTICRAWRCTEGSTMLACAEQRLLPNHVPKARCHPDVLLGFDEPSRRRD